LLIHAIRPIAAGLPGVARFSDRSAGRPVRGCSAARSKAGACPWRTATS